MGRFFAVIADRLEHWVRQFAWLNTAPEPEGKGKPEPKVRIVAMREQGKPVLLPDNPAPHVTDWLFEIGPSVSGGMGPAVLGWQDIAAWESVTGIELEPWEARTIRQLSRAFIAQSKDSRKPDCPPPYIGDRETIGGRRDDVAARLKGAFAAMVGKPRAKAKK